MTEKNTHEITTDSRTLDEFINSLQRLFKIAIYYPSGHAILDQATDRFMELLLLLAGDNPSITLENVGDSLVFEEITINPRLPFVQEFTSILNTLDITSVTIDREVNAAEIHGFVRKILFYRAQSTSANQFVQIDVSELPHSTRVEQQQYIVRSDGITPQHSAGDAADNLNTFIESLSRYGLNDRQITDCRKLLESLPRKIPESGVDLSDLPHASWDDVALLLARTVKGRDGSSAEGMRQLATHANVNALASILKKLEDSSKDRNTRQTINLLISVIKNPRQQDLDRTEHVAQAPDRVFSESPQFSIAQIQKYTTKNRLGEDILGKIPFAPSTNETLSILMQLARYNQTLQSQIRMQQIFRELLTQVINDKSWEILSKGLEHIVREGTSRQVSTIVHQLLDPLRRSGGQKPFKLFYLTLKGCRQGDREVLWPHVVNELLISGSSTDQQTYHQLCQYAAGYQPDVMQRYFPQLQSLEAFQDKNVAADIFYAVTPACYPLFGFLLKTEIKRHVAERVVSGLKEKSGDWLISAVVPLLDISLEEHLLFLYAYLSQSTRKVSQDSIKNIAGQLIATALPRLPQERRSESWVEKTIGALAQLPSPETTALLEQIASSKKLLFIPEWPVPCRKAAKQALSRSTRR